MNPFEVAEYLFGPMRSSTEEENELIREMLRRNSKPIGVNIFETVDEDENLDSVDVSSDNNNDSVEEDNDPKLDS